MVKLVHLRVWVKFLPTFALMPLLNHGRRVVADLLQHLNLLLPVELPLEDIIVGGLLLEPLE